MTPRLALSACALILSPLAASAQDLPTYHPPEVRAVATTGGEFHSLGGTLRINARADLLLRPRPTEHTSILWVNGQSLILPAVAAVMGHPELADTGDVYFRGRLTDDPITERIWRFTPPAWPPEPLTGAIPSASHEGVAVTDAGAVTYFEGDHRLVRWRPATGETVTIT